jgi:hypothetical protein
MKRFGVVILFMLIFFGKSEASQRMVLAEMFTNTGCPPCGPADDTLDQIAEDFTARLAVIRYHTWWPSSQDPFYQANIPENSARISYYGTNYTPRLIIDGTVDGQYFPQTWRSLIQQRFNVDSPLEIDLSGTIDTVGRTGSITAQIIATGSVSGTSLRIRYAIIESELYYPWYGPPYHNQTFRDMFPDVGGIPLTISLGDTVTDVEEFTLSDTWVIENCEIVVFVQDDGTRSILQAAKIPVLDLTGVEESSGDLSLHLTPPLPNPTRGSIEFSITLKASERVNLSIYNSAGRRVYTLHEGYLPQGTHRIKWNGRDNMGRKVRSGVYWLRVESESLKVTEKIIILD